ncbi:M20 family peptidase [Sporolactobacillus sp. THM7-4]|nr:M20 family peptidase [Sporolactobacillus sp. THM7-4]
MKVSLLEMHQLVNAIDKDQALSFLQSLVRINSVNPPGNERLMAELITETFAQNGLTAKQYSLDADRKNVLLMLKGTDLSQDQRRRSLVLSGHLDTVPVGNAKWQEDPWGAHIKDGKLYGRGSSDMKSGVAAMILAINAIAKSGIKLKGDLSFLGTAGEEVDGRGARLAIHDGTISGATALVIGEPTNNQLFIAHKGVLWLEITINGKTAHAGWPDKGINAISAMHHFVNELEKFQPVHDKILGNSTINLGLINGGIAPNMVADTCRLTIDCRTVPGLDAERIYQHAEEILITLSENLNISYSLRIINNMHFVSTPQENPFIQLSAKVFKESFEADVRFGGANYYSDGSLFTKGNEHLPILIFGPGNPDQAHQPNEWVSLDQYYAAIRYYAMLAIRYLGAD